MMGSQYSQTVKSTASNHRVIAKAAKKHHFQSRLFLMHRLIAKYIRTETEIHALRHALILKLGNQ